VNSRTVTIRARVARRGVGETTVLVQDNGEMLVKVFSPKEGFCFVSAERAELSVHAKRQAWKASKFKRGET
jgi:hypothetical protein